MAGFDERMLNGMGVLAAIVDTGSFAGAGEILDMSQSGVSRAIARLEGRLGVRLLERTTRSVTLTDEGRRFYEQVMPLLGALEEATTHATQGATAVRGRLRVNVDPFFSRFVLGPQLGSFIEEYPELRVELVTRDQLGDMIADGFELAVRFGHPQPSTLVARKLLETRILTVAAPSYLKRHGRPLQPADLERDTHACIRYRDPATGHPFDWEFHRGRKKLVVDVAGRLTVNDVGTMHSVCLAGHAIAQVMELGVEAPLADGRLVDLFPDWPDDRFPLYALYPSRRYVPAKVRAFLDFIVSLAAPAAHAPARKAR
ncbi:LysR family transcriptional regulator [Burkholderia vietnamiensis]|uniref:LysR family transcriptional regulator n=1 Tax=Burkholderia vietnamiensis TaxID=60552 RepID=UPI00075D7CC8|nr:LysR family transcriptional regulator [Burkholderia vietnamiensis]KVE62672.1 LysR family transcriptional regulator [Burkholderia vietnamiensis]TPQ42657.1 LysR family transcriptional regulator [Burkholderia ubonensis]HDR9240334.1 LysR family transcriptional regulator [Burkholderia vietnamiensis]